MQKPNEGWCFALLMSNNSESTEPAVFRQPKKNSVRTVCKFKSESIMKRLILTGLTLGSMVVASPAFALSDRFEDARQDTINRFKDTPLQRLSQPFDDAQQDILDK